MANWLEKFGIPQLSMGDRQGGVTSMFRHAMMIDTYHREEAKRLNNKAAAETAGTFSPTADRGCAYRNWLLWVRACHIVNIDPGQFETNDNHPLKITKTQRKSA